MFIEDDDNEDPYFDIDDDLFDDITKYVNTFQLSPISINIVVYIAGWVVMRVKIIIKCTTWVRSREDESLIDCSC